MIIPPIGATFGRELYVSDVLITPPTIEPIDLDEVKKHLRFTPTSEDTLIDTYIAMARQYFEQYTGLALMDQTWETRIEAFPGGFNPWDTVVSLGKSPVIALESVVYDDSDGVEQSMALADYALDLASAPGLSVVRPVTSWPRSAGTLGSVRLRYRAGFGSQPGDVPELIKGVLYLLVGYFHQFRSEAFVNSPGASLEKLPLGAELIMRNYKALNVRPALRLSV
jgi:uncharacterized phiE125 gp8 family phage protein